LDAVWSGAVEVGLQVELALGAEADPAASGWLDEVVAGESCDAGSLVGVFPEAVAVAAGDHAQ